MSELKVPEQTRPISAIAGEILDTWDRPWFGAVPYIQAMCALDKITDRYGQDSADDIVAYFLVNAKTWRGANARRIKDELRAMLADHRKGA